jgi:ABC-type sugar transport system, periplasmic component
MKKFGFLASFMAFAILLGSCGAAVKPGQSQQSTSQQSTAKANTEATVLNMAFMTLGTTAKDMQAVEDEVNKITLEKINAKVKVMPISQSAWIQQMTLMLSGNEKLDLAIEAGYDASFSTQVANGQWLPLDELLQKNGTGVLKAINDIDPIYLKSGKINGKIYGVPTIGELANSDGIVMRKDIVEKYKINLDNIKTLDDVENMLLLIKKNEPDLTPVMPQAPSDSMVAYLGTWDRLGDFYGVLKDFSQDELKVENLFATQEYFDICNKMYKWYQEGLILKDAATNQQSAVSLVKAGKAFSYMMNLAPGAATTQSLRCGREMVVVELIPPMAITINGSCFMWGIPRNCSNTEKAMELMNLLYTDNDIENLLTWGIKGKHYVVTDDPSGKVIDYPQGVNAENTGYGMGIGFEMGNMFLTYVWKGDSPDLYTQVSEFNKIAKKSKAFGFTFDPTPVKTEYAAVTNVYNQYRIALECGQLNPETEIPKFVKALKDAGIEKIISEKQAQLDKWAQEQ